MKTLNYQAYISCDRTIMVGKPRIKGTRITVEAILDMLASGMTVSEITNDYPSLNTINIQAALQYAAHHIDGKNKA